MSVAEWIRGLYIFQTVETGSIGKERPTRSNHPKWSWPTLKERDGAGLRVDIPGPCRRIVAIGSCHKVDKNQNRCCGCG